MTNPPSNHVQETREAGARKLLADHNGGRKVIVGSAGSVYINEDVAVAAILSLLSPLQGVAFPRVGPSPANCERRNGFCQRCGYRACMALSARPVVRGEGSDAIPKPAREALDQDVVLRSPSSLASPIDPRGGAPLDRREP